MTARGGIYGDHYGDGREVDEGGASVSGQMKLVPVEPTEEMLAALDREYRSHVIHDHQSWRRRDAYRTAYRAMIEASPTPVDEWRPIESAPKDGTSFFATWADKHFDPVVAHIEGGVVGYLTDDMGFTQFDSPPTHYLPLSALPAPPRTLASDLKGQEK